MTLRHTILMAVVGLAMAGLAAGPAQAADTPAALPPTAGDVDKAVERGISYIWSLQQPDGAWPRFILGNGNVFTGGHEAIAMTALAYAGEPLTKPEMKKGLEVLMGYTMDQTYCLGFRTIALAELYRHGEPNLRAVLRAAMTKDIEQLVKMATPCGAWDYTTRDKDDAWDFSNTQIAILAIQQATLCGVEIKPDLLLRLQSHYLKKQRDDGGWNYGRPGQYANIPSSGSMTAASVASLLLIRDLLDGSWGCPCRSGRSAGQRDPKTAEAIARGVKWLADHFNANTNPPDSSMGSIPYWLYAAERVGMATGLKYLGTHDWYAEGAAALLKAQAANGSWGSLSDTCFATLFLIKGRGPILMNKLMYDGQWDRHPHDLEGLCDIVGLGKEQRINWQAIHLDLPVEAMHDSPVLYLSAEAAITLSEEHKKKLRAYTDSGGTILFEAACGNTAASDWWKRTCREIWPEWELTLVDRTHPLWSADLDLRGRRPTLLGAGDGIRTFLFYSAQDISCYWTTRAVVKNKMLFDLGINLYGYASDRGKFRARLARREIGTGDRYALQKPVRGTKDAVTLARVRHGGDWFVGRNYQPWQVLAADVQARTGLAVKELDPVTPGEAIPAGTSLLYLSGRTGCDLAPGAAAWLKSYLAGGGLLFAEAVLGDKRFDEAFRAAMDSVGLTVAPLTESPIVSGKFASGAGYAIPAVGYTPALVTERAGQSAPLLYGLYDGQKLVGIYSPFDIMYSQTGCKAFGNRGYAADDARALATNLLLMLSSR